MHVMTALKKPTAESPRPGARRHAASPSGAWANALSDRAGAVLKTHNARLATCSMAAEARHCFSRLPLP
jgi:hypothetical protein